MRRNMNKFLRPRWAVPAAAAASVLLAFCIHEGTETEPGPVPYVTAGPAPASVVVHPTFKFNNRGGVLNLMHVYPGTSDSAADKISNGTYANGTELSVVCHQDGRREASNPAVGEDLRESDDWYQVVGVGSTVVQFATGVYGDILPPDAAIPEC